MTDRHSRPGLCPFLLAAFLAATGLFRVYADGLELNLRAGKNYETVEVRPSVTGSWPDSTLTLVATDARGAAYAETVTGLSLETNKYDFLERTAGRTVAVEGYIVSSDGSVTNAEAHTLLVMGNVHTNGWMAEDAKTFADDSGSGVWTGKDYAHVEEGWIVIATDDLPDAKVLCTVGEAPRPRRGYTITTTATFNEISGDPEDPGDRPLGLTIACADDDDPNKVMFAFVEQGAWRGVPIEVCDPTQSQTWQVHISADCANGCATYYVRPNAAGPWTVLGTAQCDGLGTVAAAEFLGTGAINGLKGDPFDTQLVDVNVTFGDKTLYPGCNFEQTIITGRVTAAEAHETSRRGGTYTIRLTGLDGEVILTKDYTFTIGGEMEFYVKATDLVAGRGYRVEVIINSEGESNPVENSAMGVMGRSLTNETWGVKGSWIFENSYTYLGDEPSTGYWQGGDYIQTEDEDEWLYVNTEPPDRDVPLDAAVLFYPTNELERTDSYTIGFRAMFEAASNEPDPEFAICGVTIGSTEDGLRFLCLSNMTWETVKNAGFVPELGVEYQFIVFVEKGSTKLDYFVTDSDGNSKLLMSVDMMDILCEDVKHFELLGHGELTDLEGFAYSTELVRLEIGFDEDALYPGTNFEATAANGYVRIQPLWETDHTNGQIRVVVRDRWGDVVGQRRISFHGLTGRDFEYYIEGLIAGETYTVDAAVEVSGADVIDSEVRTGTMARPVTNELWVADGWIREDIETFRTATTGVAGKIGSGVWDIGEVMACEQGEYISVNTTVSDDEFAHVSCTSTNELPVYTGFELRSRLVFDTACVNLPQVHGEYGLTVVYAHPESMVENDEYLFAILSNGVWTTISADLYEPRLDVEYELTVKVDRKEGTAYYAIREDIDDQPSVIASFDVADHYTDATPEAAFYGVGRVRSHEGDAFDVSLVRISVDFDDAALTPGTNFSSTVAAGILHIKPIWPTDRDSGEFTIYVRDAYGNLVGNPTTLTYHELSSQSFKVPIEGLEAGGVYDIEVVASLEGVVVGTDQTIAWMARHVGTWIDEDAATFAGERVGTGRWQGTNETASVTGEGEERVIHIEADVDTEPVLYEPTNDTASVRCSTLREIRVDLSFEDVGWYASEIPPDVPLNALAGVTIWNDDLQAEESESDYALAVLSNGTWTVLESTRRRCDLLSFCSVTALIDYRNGFVRYDVATPVYSNRVCQYDFEPCAAENEILSFAGAGYVRSLDGDVWNPNLITDGTNEFSTLDEAIRGSNGLLSPLWWADQLVTVGRGTFRVLDTNNWLNVRFPWWYYVIIEGDEIKVYRFNQSNNWIDYAADGDENIEEIESGFFLVKTPEGLAWVAAMATNAWVSGRVELDRDIDLSAHNWTPIAGFSGAFDGRNHTITGLNNLFHNWGIPGGEYVSGPTNLWGRSTYGLFGTATNAVLRNVTFAGATVSNIADSVAVLVGALAGDATVSNVAVTSGSWVRAYGETVAGVVGAADHLAALTVVNVTNEADIVAVNETYGVGLAAAGVLTVGGGEDGPDGPLPTLVVTNNVNRGVISGTIYDIDLTGGNLAQILAGTSLGSCYGEVALSNNVAEGSVAANPVRSPDNVLTIASYPVVNLAPAFWGTDAEGVFRTYLDGNVPGTIPVDPVHRTARMLSGQFPNGLPNPTGLLNDRITAMSPGGTVTMTESVESWGPIIIDRNLTFSLGNYAINTIYVTNTFYIAEGVAAKVCDGTIIVGFDNIPFAGDLSNLDTNQNLTISMDSSDFEHRTIGAEIDGVPYFTSDYLYIAQAINSAGTVIELFEDSSIEIDVEAGTVRADGHLIARLADCYGFSVNRDAQGNIINFTVRIADAAAPTASFDLSGAGDGKVRVQVSNAFAGFEYALQHKELLAEDWSEPTDDSWVEATSGTVVLESVATGTQGYYRVMMREKPKEE